MMRKIIWTTSDVRNYKFNKKCTTENEKLSDQRRRKYYYHQANIFKNKQNITGKIERERIYNISYWNLVETTKSP